jgi:TrmH family RNA methyltransferase
MERITSPQNPRVKLAAKLHDRRARQKQGRFPIDGVRELLRALEAGVRPVEAYVCPEQLGGADGRTAMEILRRVGCQLAEVTPGVMEKLAYGDRSEGIVAVVSAWTPTLAEMPRGDAPLFAVLEGIEKPGNVGAVLRSADAAGATGLILADAGTDLFNPNAVRASLGTIFTVPVCCASTEETLAWLRDKGMRIYAARVDGAIPYTEADFRQPAAIVLGSEAEGLTRHWHAPDIIPIRLPMHGRADSLNVSATAAVLLYEAVRQRGGTEKSEARSQKSEV